MTSTPNEPLSASESASQSTSQSASQGQTGADSGAADIPAPTTPASADSDLGYDEGDTSRDDANTDYLEGGLGGMADGNV